MAGAWGDCLASIWPTGCGDVMDGMGERHKGAGLGEAAGQGAIVSIMSIVSTGAFAGGWGVLCCGGRGSAGLASGSAQPPAGLPLRSRSGQALSGSEGSCGRFLGAAVRCPAKAVPWWRADGTYGTHGTYVTGIRGHGGSVVSRGSVPRATLRAEARPGCSARRAAKGRALARGGSWRAGAVRFVPFVP